MAVAKIDKDGAKVVARSRSSLSQDDVVRLDIFVDPTISSVWGDLVHVVKSLEHTKKTPPETLRVRCARGLGGIAVVVQQVPSVGEFEKEAELSVLGEGSIIPDNVLALGSRPLKRRQSLVFILVQRSIAVACV